MDKKKKLPLLKRLINFLQLTRRAHAAPLIFAIKGIRGCVADFKKAFDVEK